MKVQPPTTTACKPGGLQIIVLALLLISSAGLRAQCPSNIDFEFGDFRNWQCYTGTFVSPSNLTLNPSAPTPGRHEMYSSAPPGAGRDPYGNFPINCPNGSGHSIRLGNNGGGGQAEGVSYTFTIPAGQNEFNIIYNYAVVLQDGGVNHDSTNQPRLLIRVRNVTDNQLITCSSFPFIVGGLTGFEPYPPNPTILYKDWAANSINLDGMGGKTIELFFITTDCGFSAHFGYAYIDVNTECSSAFTGAAYCPDDTAITVTAPFGYQSYSWWNAGFTQFLGNNQSIYFNPPPPPGTQIAVILEPFAGYGCLDTLYANLLDTLNIRADAGPDQLACNRTTVQIGVPPRPYHLYSWSPVTGLSNPNASNPFVNITSTTQYILTTSSAGGGCVNRDTVIVQAAVLDSSIQLTGVDMYCLGDPLAAVLKVQPADSIQWYRNGIAIPGATQTQYSPTQSGTYHATVFSFIGCRSNTLPKAITVYDNPVAGYNITSAATQCFKNNQFVFTNSSTIASGSMQYYWDLGDGNTSTATDVNHSYARTGTFTVKLKVTSGNGCVDSFFRTVTVNANAVVSAVADTYAQCYRDHVFTFTNNTTVEAGNALQYLWSFGDGNFSTQKDISHSYTLPGAYTVKLLVTTDKGCADSLSMNVRVHPTPVAGFTVNSAQQCFGGNDFVLTNTSTIYSGTSNYSWTFGDGNSATGVNVNHSYAQPGDYRIRMIASSDSGCVDSTFRDVNIIKYPFADFFVKDPACVNQEVLTINKTLNNTSSTLIYRWDFGNGQSSPVRSPGYSYPAAGNFNLSLTVSTAQCPTTYTSKTIPIVIEAPAPGMVYPVKEAITNFPEKLQARQIGNNIIWSPGISLDSRFIYTPTFRGAVSQLYTIQLTTPSGCVTVDTQFVKVKKKIEIYVPTVFTPDNNGINDFLRPLLMGFDHVNYFRIYDRWGKMLFQMKSDRPGWDGKFNGQPVDMQSVVWMIEAVDVDGVTHHKQGTTVILR